MLCRSLEVLDPVIQCDSSHLSGIAHHLGMTGTEPQWGPFGRAPGGYTHHYLPPHCGPPPGMHAPHFPAHVLALTNPDQPLGSPTRLSSGMTTSGSQKRTVLALTGGHRPDERAFRPSTLLYLGQDISRYTRVGILILATPRQIGYKNCWSDATMQQEGWVLPLPTYIMGAVHHEIGIRSSQLIVSRCRDSV